MTVLSMQRAGTHKSKAWLLCQPRIEGGAPIMGRFCGRSSSFISVISRATKYRMLYSGTVPLTFCNQTLA